jgi:hypothetical protein
VLLHSSASVSETLSSASPVSMPGIVTAGAFVSTVASAPTTSCRTRPVWWIEAGAPGAARIVGAMSISSGCCSNATSSRNPMAAS